MQNPPTRGILCHTVGMIAFALGMFGLVIGSFLNVVILRRGVRGIGGRSGCMHCKHVLAWYDLIPIFSWLSKRGRCRYCKSRVSMQYPLVEMGTAGLFALIGGSTISPFSVPIACVIAALLICIFVYDLRHTIIPDPWVWSFVFLAFLLTTNNYQLVTILAGPIVAFPLFLLWLVSHGRWMGFGDVKLALGMGWLVGLTDGLFSLWLAFALGAVLMLAMLAWQRLAHRYHYAHRGRGLTMKSEVPFGPFLITSLLIVWISGLYGYDITVAVLALAGW